MMPTLAKGRDECSKSPAPATSGSAGDALPTGTPWSAGTITTSFPKNRRLDADERELIVRAIGLYDIHPDAAYTFDDRRLKRLARGFCRTRCLDLVADPS